MKQQPAPPPPPRRQRRYKLGFYAFFTTAGIGGLGYFSYLQYTDGQQAAQDASNCATELDKKETENTILRKQVASCATTETKIKEVEGSLAEVQGNLTATQAELEQLREQKREAAKRLAAFKELTAKFQKMIDTGKLDVLIRNGQMIVKLPAGVLFPSGSAVLSRDGELALMEVAVILREFKDRRFMIAGHTDNRPLENTSETVKYGNNWELSVGRAVTVTQFLIEARMSADNLVAAGYGEHDPVGNNTTAAGRQENRRIEIILLPDIRELPMLN